MLFFHNYLTNLYSRANIREFCIVNTTRNSLPKREFLREKTLLLPTFRDYDAELLHHHLPRLATHLNPEIHLCKPLHCQKLLMRKK